MYNQSSDTYKFTLVSYEQHEGNIPVFRSHFRLLLRNNEQHDLVWVSANLRALGDYESTPDAGIFDAEARSKSFQDPDFLNPDSIDGVRTVIWAGTDTVKAVPRLAVMFTARKSSPAGESWLYVVDAETGDMLLKEDRRHHFEVSGTVSGIMTDGWHSAFCDTSRVTRALVRTIVTAGGQSVYTDSVTGEYTLTGLSGDVTVSTEICGEYFCVYNAAGAEASLSEVVSQTDTVDFVFNEVDSELVRAQADAYYHANKVRDFVLKYAPGYPGLDHDSPPMALYVNDTLASTQYVDGTIVFGIDCESEDTVNHAYSQIVYHEYAHHMLYEILGEDTQGRMERGSQTVSHR
jgi:hypothetical protein